MTTDTSTCREAFERWYRETNGINWTGQEPNVWIAFEAAWSAAQSSRERT